jgi:hypothetical protein
LGKNWGTAVETLVDGFIYVVICYNCPELSPIPFEDRLRMEEWVAGHFKATGHIITVTKDHQYR